MAEVWVDRYTYNLSIKSLKVSDTITERDDLGGAYKSANKQVQLVKRINYSCECLLQIQWIKEQNQIFALVIVQFYFLEISINHRSSFEEWCLGLNVGNTQSRSCNVNEKLNLKDKEVKMPVELKRTD